MHFSIVKIVAGNVCNSSNYNRMTLRIYFFFFFFALHCIAKSHSSTSLLSQNSSWSWEEYKKNCKTFNQINQVFRIEVSKQVTVGPP